jgi:hypothetical protein
LDLQAFSKVACVISSHELNGSVVRVKL